MNSQKKFLKTVLIWALAIRVALAVVLTAGGLTYKLRLSPDSERYHRVAIEINADIENKVSTRYTWQDHGWFRFTALVYRVFGAHSWIIQACNITFSVLTIYIVSILASRICKDIFVYRAAVGFTAFFPSFIYWSCHMLKDPIAILAMTTLITGTVILRHQFSWRWMLAVIGTLLVYFGIRDYMFFVGGFLFLISITISLPAFGKSVGSAVIALPIVLCALPYFLGMGLFGYTFFTESHYFDLEYINHVRGAMGDHGSGAMYSDGRDVGVWTGDVLNNAKVALTGIFYFFFVIDLTDVSSIRQILALPEVILFIVLLPSMWRGVRIAYRQRKRMLPLLTFVFVVMVVYLSATTNMGALFRWKMQVMPALMILIAMGIRSKPKSYLYRGGCHLLKMKPGGFGRHGTDIVRPRK